MDVSDYYCKTCWAKFTRLSAYVDHIKYEVCRVRSGTAVCGALGCKEKSDLKDLKHHVLSQHRDLGKFVCKTCFVGFDHHLKFLSHAASKVCWEKVLVEATDNAKRQQRGLSLMCPVADCSFVAHKSQDLFDHGEDAHPNSESYECKRCHKTFSGMTGTICHYLQTDCCRAGQNDDSQDESRGINIVCGLPDCNEAVSSSAIVRHIIVSHPGSAAFVCKKCNSNFAAITSFVHHAKTCNALQKKPSGSEVGFQPRYRCFYCKAMFDDYDAFEFHHDDVHLKKKLMVQLWNASSNKYTRHSNVNAREVDNEYMCSVCAVHMANKETLMKHILIVHQWHCCPHCGLVFGKGDELKKHTTETHGKFEKVKAAKEKELERKARVASEKRKKYDITHRNSDELQSGKGVQRYGCYLCSLVCETKSSLQEHAALRHRVYICSHCEYTASGETALNDFKIHIVLRHLSAGAVEHPTTQERIALSAVAPPETSGETPGRPVLRGQTASRSDSTPNGSPSGSDSGIGRQDCDQSNGAAFPAKRKHDGEYTRLQPKAKRRATPRIVSSSEESEEGSERGGTEGASTSPARERHQCERCGKRFGTRNGLHQHMAEHHRLRYFCGYCNVGTTQKQQLCYHQIKKHLGHAFKYITLEGDAFVEREGPPSLSSAETLLRNDGRKMSASGASSDLEGSESEWSPHYFSDDTVNEERTLRRSTRSASHKARIAETPTSTSETAGSTAAEAIEVSASASEVTDDDADAAAPGERRRHTKRVSDGDASLCSVRSTVGRAVEKAPPASSGGVEPALPSRDRRTTAEDVPAAGVGENPGEGLPPRNEDDGPISALDIMKMKDKRFGQSDGTEGINVSPRHSDMNGENHAAKEGAKKVRDKRQSTAVSQKKRYKAALEPPRRQRSTRKETVLFKQKSGAAGMHESFSPDSRFTLADDELQAVPVKEETGGWNEIEECATSEAAEEPEKLSISPPTTPYKVFGGYRVPKTAEAFHKLLQNIGDVYKCCEFACSFSTMSPQRFVSHLQRHDTGHLFCIYCGAVIPDATQLLAHLDAEHSRSANQCTKCLYRASTQRHIECHFAHAHPNESSSYVTLATGGGPEDDVTSQLESSRPYPCGFETCSFNTMKTSELFQHLRSAHSNELSYPCPLCEERKEDVDDLASHFPEHGINNVQCAYCSHCSVTIGGIILHLCYCHADRVVKFHFRSSDLEEEFIKVLKGSTYVLPHYFADLVREKTPTLSMDLEHIVFQQRCPFCTAWCSGFKAFRIHVLSEHKPAVRSEELAESLFENYGFRAAVREGRCPFCSRVAESTAELQEHILDEELVYAPYECHLCMHTFGTEKELDEHLFDKHVDEQKLVFHNPDAELLAWVQSNIIMGTSACGESSGALDRSEIGSCRLEEAGDASGTLLVTSVYSTVNDSSNVLCGESAASGEHRCGECGLTTFSETYYRKHLQTCEARPREDPCSQEVFPPGTCGHEVGAAKFVCTICSAGFPVMQTFAHHCRDAHDLHFFCTICFRGSKTKTGLRDHLKVHHQGQGDGKAYIISNSAKKGLRKSTDFHLSVCDLDSEAGLCEPEEPSRPNDDGFSYYGTEYIHVHARNLTVTKDGAKTSVRSVMKSANYEPYVLVKDFKHSLG